jgi:hypothetical protein
MDKEEKKERKEGECQEKLVNKVNLLVKELFRHHKERERAKKENETE